MAVGLSRRPLHVPIMTPAAAAAGEASGALAAAGKCGGADADILRPPLPCLASPPPPLALSPVSFVRRAVRRVQPPPHRALLLTFVGL